MPHNTVAINEVEWLEELRYGNIFYHNVPWQAEKTGDLYGCREELPLG